MAMNVGSFYKFSFNVRRGRQSPPINDLPHSSGLPQDEVAIEFRVTECRQIQKFIGDGLRPVSVSETRSPRTPTSFWVPKHAALLSDGGARMMSLLSDKGVLAKHQEAVLRDIAAVAGAQSAGTETSPIVVTLEHMRVVLLEFDDDNMSRDEIDMVLRECVDVDLVSTTPATRSSMEQLEKVTDEEGLGSIDEASLCPEEFKVAVELTRLPCSHVRPEDCPFKWLEKITLCPPSRYPWPASDVSRFLSNF